MKTSTSILTFASLLTSAFSRPSPAIKTLAVDDTNSWPVTNFICPAGSPAGCVYSFNLVYTPSPSTAVFSEPAINTFCNGTNIQDKLNPCEDASVSTNLVNGFQNSTLVIQHKWNPTLSDGSIATTWVLGNFTWAVGGDHGYIPPTTFEVPQMEAYAIA